MGLGFLLVSGGGWSRVVAELPGMSARGIFAHFVKPTSKVVMGNVITVCRSVDPGFPDDISESLRRNSPLWIHEFARVVVYCF